eukprot:RCo044690
MAASGRSRRAARSSTADEEWEAYDPALFEDSPPAAPTVTRSGRSVKAAPRFGADDEDFGVPRRNSASRGGAGQSAPEGSGPPVVDTATPSASASTAKRKREILVGSDSEKSDEDAPTPKLGKATSAPPPEAPTGAPGTDSSTASPDAKLVAEVIGLAASPHALLRLSGRPVSESSTEAEIQAAYLALSMRIHPDKVRDVDPSKATAAFQILLDAAELCKAQLAEKAKPQKADPGRKRGGGAAKKGTAEAGSPAPPPKPRAGRGQKAAASETGSGPVAAASSTEPVAKPEGPP